MVLTESGYEGSRKARFVPLLRNSPPFPFIHLFQMELRKESAYEESCGYFSDIQFHNKIYRMFVIVI